MQLVDARELEWIEDEARQADEGLSMVPAISEVIVSEAEPDG